MSSWKPGNVAAVARQGVSWSLSMRSKAAWSSLFPIALTMRSKHYSIGSTQRSYLFGLHIDSVIHIAHNEHIALAIAVVQH